MKNPGRGLVEQRCGEEPEEIDALIALANDGLVDVAAVGNGGTLP